MSIIEKFTSPTSFECPICGNCLIAKDSISAIAGACAQCRYSIIPKYISSEQHKKYIELYLKKRNYQ